MRALRLIAGILVLLAGPRSLARAQTDAAATPAPSDADATSEAALPDVVTLAQLYALADTSPRLLAAEESADAALGDVTRAGTLDNPVLGYEIWGLVGGEQTNGGSQQQIAVSQLLPWPGQLDARVAAARASHRADRAEVDRARALLRLEVRRAFVSLVAAERHVALLEEARARIEAVAEIVRGRASAGAGRRWDVLRIDAELASLSSAHEAALAERTVVSGRIAILVGRPGWLPRAPAEWTALPALEDRASDGPATEHPSLVAARLAREAAESALARERSDAVPAIELRLGAVVSTWPEGGYLYGGIAMPLPFFDQNQGAITRAEHEVAAARASEEATRLELESALLAARAAETQREQALAELDVAAEHATELRAMAEAAFRGGEISVFELLDAVRATRTLAEERLEREEAVRAAEIDVLRARLGAEP